MTEAKNVFIVYAHHETTSYNAALCKAAKDKLTSLGHKVVVSDLYAMNFNPITSRKDIVGPPENKEHFNYALEASAAYARGATVPDVKAEMDKVKAADLIIFQFPMYWLSFPAILKGWFDRVWIGGFAFSMQGPLLKNKRALLSFTAAGPDRMYTARGYKGDMNVILWPLQYGVLRYAGLDVLAPAEFLGVLGPREEYRKAKLAEYEKRLEGIFQEKPLSFVEEKHFGPDRQLTDEFVDSQKDKDVGPSVGQNLNKLLPQDSMRKAT